MVVRAELRPLRSPWRLSSGRCAHHGRAPLSVRSPLEMKRKNVEISFFEKCWNIFEKC
jgi:hypothetical protein